jgi:hypothetical protein
VNKLSFPHENRIPTAGRRLPPFSTICRVPIKGHPETKSKGEDVPPPDLWLIGCIHLGAKWRIISRCFFYPVSAALFFVQVHGKTAI